MPREYYANKQGKADARAGREADPRGEYGTMTAAGAYHAGYRSVVGEEKWKESVDRVWEAGAERRAKLEKKYGERFF